jgi:hypothetical protein
MRQRSNITLVFLAFSMALWISGGCSNGIIKMNPPFDPLIDQYTGASQGVAVDPAGNFYVSSTKSISAFDSNWHSLWTNASPFTGMPSTVIHIGDIEYYNGNLYAPVEGYVSCGSYAPVVLAVYSASTGNLVTWSNITTDGHEASSVTVIPKTGQVVVTSFCNDGGYNTLWSYDLNTLTTNPAGSTISYRSTISLSASIYSIQGISWNAKTGYFLVSADMENPAGTLWFVSSTGEVNGPIYTVPLSAGTELEGVDYTSGYIYYLENGYVHGIGLPTDAPTFNVAAGNYQSPQVVRISDATAGATIYYTINGKMPTTSSTVYDGPIAVSSTETLKAIAAAGDSATSPMTTATYTIIVPAIK